MVCSSGAACCGFSGQRHLRARDFEQIEPGGRRQDARHLVQHIHIAFGAGTQAVQLRSVAPRGFNLAVECG